MLWMGFYIKILCLITNESLLELILQFIWLIVLFRQKKLGTRFFLPERLRKLKYNCFLINYTKINDYNIEAKEWDLCLNKLYEPELEYSNNRKSNENLRFKFGCFYLAKCGHSFHPRCLLKSIKKESICSKCDELISMEL